MASLIFYLSLWLTTVSCISATSVKINLEEAISQLALDEESPKPTSWPEQFHSLCVMNNSRTKELQVVDLWYDWPNRRNLNLIQTQLGKKLYDVEHNNGTSYYFTRDKNQECRIMHFEVGILPTDWLVNGANYLGQRVMDGFLCNVWEKAEFIRYYEDVVTKRPVYWLFFTTGQEFHVMTFEVGAVLEDSEWQAPVYCFDKEKQTSVLGQAHSIMRPIYTS